MTVGLSDSALETLVFVLCVTPILLHIYGSIGSVGSFSEGSALRDFYSYSRLHSEGGYGQILGFRPHFQKISVWIMMHLPIRKDYCGEPMHHSGVSNLMALFTKMGYVYTIHHPATTVKINPLISCITVYPFTLTREPVNRYRIYAAAQKNEKIVPPLVAHGAAAPS